MANPDPPICRCRACEELRVLAEAERIAAQLQRLVPRQPKSTR